VHLAPSVTARRTNWPAAFRPCMVSFQCLPWQCRAMTLQSMICWIAVRRYEPQTPLGRVCPRSAHRQSTRSDHEPTVQEIQCSHTIVGNSVHCSRWHRKPRHPDVGVGTRHRWRSNCAVADRTCHRDRGRQPSHVTSRARQGTRRRQVADRRVHFRRTQVGRAEDANVDVR